MAAKDSKAKASPVWRGERAMPSAEPSPPSGFGLARRDWMMLAAVGGLLAVAIGAFAAHGMKDPKAAELLRTGASYQFMHSMAVFACATFMQIGARWARFAPAFFLPGIVLFCGSLYALAFGAPRWVGVITPVGGLLFLCGWGVLIWASRLIDQPAKAIYLNSPRPHVQR